MKQILKRLAYASGALSAHFRHSRGETLTVAMFHRVLRDDDARWRDADPQYAVSQSFFAGCLGFFARHYNVVRLDDVVAARAGGAALPPRALLITFDDGWADNLEVAAPMLSSAGQAAVIFLAAEAVLSADDEWWQERLFGACRDGALPEDLPRAVLTDAAADGAAPRELALAAALSALPPERREALLAGLPHREGGRRMMLRPGDLREAVRHGLALGLHGHTHAPLALLADPGADIRRAREALAAAAGSLATWTALAFPHGSYDDAVLRAARDAGMDTVFTSEPHINAAPGGRPGGACLGRIEIPQHEAADGRGRLDEAKLAAWLWRREVA